MQYKFTYSPPKNYSAGGMGVMLNQVIYNLFSLSKITEISNYYINWCNKDILYYDQSIGNNVWEYYFHNNKSENSYVDYNKKYYPHLNKKYLNEYHINMNTTNSIDKNKIILLHNIYKKFITIKKEIVSDASTFIDVNLIGKTLGVHYRYTDKIKEVSQISPLKLINILDGVIEEYDSIFIATDYQPIIDELINLSEKIKFSNSQRSKNGVGSHFIKNDRENDNYLKGYECIFDALVLSKCNDYYYSRSNVSLMPLIFNNMSYNSISLINTM